MNEAACKLFKKADEKADADKAPDIDWLNTSVLLSLGEKSPVTAKVCAILDSEKNDKATAYISLNAAKALLKDGGYNAARQAHVRIKNIGCAGDVSTRLSAFGLTAENADTELQARWDGWTMEMTYLFIMGFVLLLCSMALISAWRRITVIENQEAYEALHYQGMGRRTITHIFALHALTTSLVGAVVGILIALILPAFLPQDLAGVSIFMLQTPVTMMLICMALCVGISQLRYK